MQVVGSVLQFVQLVELDVKEVSVTGHVYLLGNVIQQFVDRREASSDCVVVHLSSSRRYAPSASLLGNHLVAYQCLKVPAEMGRVGLAYLFLFLHLIAVELHAGQLKTRHSKPGFSLHQGFVSSLEFGTHWL
jgi:hypothetical protein